MTARRNPRIPTYRDTSPVGLAMSAELEALGLHADVQEPVALYTFCSPDGGGGTCGLHERAAAVPREQGAS